MISWIILRSQLRVGVMSGGRGLKRAVGVIVESAAISACVNHSYIHDIKTPWVGGVSHSFFLRLFFLGPGTSSSLSPDLGFKVQLRCVSWILYPLSTESLLC